MSNIKMELNIDVKDADQLIAVSNFFKELAGSKSDEFEWTVNPAVDPNEVEVDADEVEPEPKKEKSKRKRASKASSKKEEAETPAKSKKAAKKASAAPPEESDDDNEDDSGGIEVEEVRALLSGVVANHRDAIKAKLTELGAKNLTSLDSENYGVFVDFLNGLK